MERQRHRSARYRANTALPWRAMVGAKSRRDGTFTPIGALMGTGFGRGRLAGRATLKLGIAPSAFATRRTHLRITLGASSDFGAWESSQERCWLLRRLFRGTAWTAAGECCRNCCTPDHRSWARWFPESWIQAGAGAQPHDVAGFSQSLSSRSPSSRCAVRRRSQALRTNDGDDTAGRDWKDDAAGSGLLDNHPSVGSHSLTGGPRVHV